MFLQNEINEKKRVLEWLDETKRLCHELRDILQHRDYPPKRSVSKWTGTTVSNSLARLHHAAENTIAAIAKVMVEDDAAVEMFAQVQQRRNV